MKKQPIDRAATYTAKEAAKLVGVRPCDLKRAYPENAHNGFPWRITGRELEYHFTTNKKVKAAILAANGATDTRAPSIAQELARF